MNRKEILDWLDDECAYAKIKRGTRRQEDVDNLVHSPNNPFLSIFYRDAEMYIGRAGTLGLDNVLGRQALGKGIAVLIAMLEATTQEWGALPAGGIPSGHATD